MPELPVVYAPAYLSYDFGPGHPFSPVRWKAIRDLLIESRLPLKWVEAEALTDDRLLCVHSDDFVSAVRAASDGVTFLHPGFFGLGTSDVPTFVGMHDATASICGGTAAAGSLVSKGAAEIVLQLGGGLHHAMRSRAAGFCVYNDMAIAIDGLLAEGLRIAYLDVDVHHGDGVQSIFYAEPNVLTISLHESGAYLFPGTGQIQELGSVDATGTSVNVPLHPGTADASYMESFEAVVPECLERFAPDVVVLEAGADAHLLDPIAHLALSTHFYETLFDRILELARRYAGGRLVAALGGGYAFDSTMRVWGTLVHRMCGAAVPATLPDAWTESWRARMLHPDWTLWGNDVGPSDAETAAHAERKNRETVAELMRLLEESRLWRGL